MATLAPVHAVGGDGHHLRDESQGLIRGLTVLENVVSGRRRTSRSQAGVGLPRVGNMQPELAKCEIRALCRLLAVLRKWRMRRLR